MDTSEILLALLALIGVFLLKKWFNTGNTPPGPWGVPILGYLPFLASKNPITIMAGFKKKYGSVFSITLGQFKCIVIHDWKLIVEAYKEDVFAGRPNFEIQMVRNHGKKRAIIFSEGKTWNEQRRFALRNLRVFGFGKQTMEGLLLHEAQELLDVFGKSVGKPTDMRNQFNASVLNSLWYICTGNRFEKDDPNFKFVIENFIVNLQKAESMGFVFFFPWILKMNIIVKGFWESFIKTRNKLQGLVQEAIDEHKNTYDPDTTRDFIDAYINKWKSTDDPESSFYNEEGELNMRLVLVDFFLAGAETTSSTLQWALLYMIMWPEVQKKVQDEIDRVIGQNRHPSLDDRSSMIYTEATLCEIHRYCALVPFSVYHRTIGDTQLGGYKIEKDTIVLANLRDAHHDKEFWGDPENFRPERFIDSNNKIIKHEAFMPFSTGKRVCLGEGLARDTLFIFFTSLMQRFSVEKDPNFGPLSLEPNAYCFIVTPKPFNSILRTRNG